MWRRKLTASNTTNHEEPDEAPQLESGEPRRAGMMATLYNDQKPEAPTPDGPKSDLLEDLLEDEIRERLRLVNPELAKEVYEIAKAQVASEAARHTRLDSKATSLVSAAGLSLTLGMSIVTLIAKGDVVATPYLWVMLAVTGLFGVAAVAFGVFALLVKGGFARVNDHNVFDKNVLRSADSPTGCDDLPTLKEKYEFGAAVYRQHMTAHLWEVSVQEHHQLNRKAKQVRDGQILFALFLLALVVCVATEFVMTSKKKDAGAAPQAAAPAAKAAVR